MDELGEAAMKVDTTPSIGNTIIICFQELEAFNLEKAQEMYTSNLCKLDAVLAPPYPVSHCLVFRIFQQFNYLIQTLPSFCCICQDYYKIQQHIWKCIWMRNGNRIVTGGIR